MSQRKPGKVRKKLADMLSEALGIPVLPDEIWDNNYPLGHYLDLARWGSNVPNGNSGVQVYSWDTMTECVRNGFTLAEDGISIEVHANENKPLQEMEP